MDILIEIGICLILAASLSLLTYKFNLLSKSGCLTSFIIGSVIGICGSIYWLVLLIVFALLGFAATLVGFTKKIEMGVQEGKHGERSYKNILGVSLPCAVFAVMNLFLGDESNTMLTIAYVSAIAVAAADTAASEIGVKDSNVWLITNFKRVEPGVNGGISVMGTAISIVAAFVVSFIGYVIIFHNLDVSILIPIICGFIGCMLDSLFGTLFEDKGVMSKYTNNCLTGLIGGLLSIILFLQFF